MKATPQGHPNPRPRVADGEFGRKSRPGYGAETNADGGPDREPGRERLPRWLGGPRWLGRRWRAIERRRHDGLGLGLGLGNRGLGAFGRLCLLRRGDGGIEPRGHERDNRLGQRIATLGSQDSGIGRLVE
jgi:hypothetical protein